MMSYKNTQSFGFELSNPVDLAIRLCTEGRRTAESERDSIEVPSYLLYSDDSSRSARIQLPRVLGESRPFHETLIMRKAVRSYGTQPLRLEHVSTLLDRVARGDAEDCATGARLGMRLQFVIVVWRVDNIVPGVYLYEPDEHCLSYIRRAPDPETEGKEMVLQIEFATAPLIILTTGNLAAATAIYGAWGYRQLLLRAGSAGQRLWLASVAMGLAGTVFAGFLPRAAHEIAGIDGYRSAGLLAFATGYSGVSAPGSPGQGGGTMI